MRSVLWKFISKLWGNPIANYLSFFFNRLAINRSLINLMKFIV